MGAAQRPRLKEPLADGLLLSGERADRALHLCKLVSQLLLAALEALVETVDPVVNSVDAAVDNILPVVDNPARFHVAVHTVFQPSRNAVTSGEEVFQSLFIILESVGKGIFVGQFEGAIPTGLNADVLKRVQTIRKAFDRSGGIVAKLKLEPLEGPVISKRLSGFTSVLF